MSKIILGAALVAAAAINQHPSQAALRARPFGIFFDKDNEFVSAEAFDDFRKKVGGGVDTIIEGQKSNKEEMEALKKEFGLIKGEVEKITVEETEFRKAFLEFQKKQQAQHRIRRHREGEVSEDCARMLASYFILDGIQRGLFQTGKQKDTVEGLFKDITGLECRTSLSSSDIPLPTLYGGEVAELVSMYGSARRFGTVIPLPALTFNLPRLGTDTAFTLLSASTAVTAKSPTVANVTFTAEKFGGLVTWPTELDEDSVVAIGQFLARYGARQFAKCEDQQFWVGTGGASGANGTAAGLTFNTITNSKVVQMAGTNTHYSDATLANFRALRAVPDEAAVQTGEYFLHTSFEQLLSGFNSSGNRPYNPNAQLGSNGNPFRTGPTLDGFPINWIPIMPAYSTSANVSKVFALFGDPSWQYLGIRRAPEVATSKEAGFTTDELMIRFTERLTVGLMALGAVAGLETAAS